MCSNEGQYIANAEAIARDALRAAIYISRQNELGLAALENALETLVIGTNRVREWAEERGESVEDEEYQGA